MDTYLVHGFEWLFEETDTQRVSSTVAYKGNIKYRVDGIHQNFTVTRGDYDIEKFYVSQVHEGGISNLLDAATGYLLASGYTGKKLDNKSLAEPTKTSSAEPPQQLFKYTARRLKAVYPEHTIVWRDIVDKYGVSYTVLLNEKLCQLDFYKDMEIVDSYFLRRPGTPRNDLLIAADYHFKDGGYTQK